MSLTEIVRHALPLPLLGPHVLPALHHGVGGGEAEPVPHPARPPPLALAGAGRLPAQGRLLLLVRPSVQRTGAGEEGPVC